MKTLFPSLDLWDFVENRYVEYDVQDLNTTQVRKMKLKDNQKKDVKALLYIQQALDMILFSKIMRAKNVKEA